MSVALITGSAGLVGSEAALYFGALGMDVVGVDNDMRAYFFGPASTTRPSPKFAPPPMAKNSSSWSSPTLPP